MPVDLPQVTFSIIPAQQLAGVTAQRVLIVGQMLAAGTATAGQLYRDFPNDGSEDTLFGAGSHIAGMIRAFKAINKVSYLDVIPLDDAVGTAGSATMTFATASATADSSIVVSFGSEIDAKVTVDISSGDDQTAIAAAVVTAIQALSNYSQLPFTVASALGVVTATAANKGTLSNDWGLSVTGEISGVGITLAGWSSGATDPTLTSVLDVIGDQRYQTILWPSAYDLTVVETLLNARFNTTNAILDGVALQVKSDTLSNLKSYAVQNSQSVVIPGEKKVDNTFIKGPATLEFPDIASAQICAIRALRFTNSALLTQYLTTVAPSDQFGGIGAATLPYFNTALPSLPVALAGNDFSQTEQAELIAAGVGTFGPNRAYSATIFGEFVTTYLTDNAGNADDSYKYLNTIDAASVIREFFFVNMKARYAQTRLTDGDLVAGRDMTNEAGIRAFCNELYDSLADDVITQKGRAAKKDYNLNLVIVVDVRNGTATITQAPLLVSQLRALTGTIQINFGG